METLKAHPDAIQAARAAMQTHYDLLALANAEPIVPVTVTETKPAEPKPAEVRPKLVSEPKLVNEVPFQKTTHARHADEPRKKRA